MKVLLYTYSPVLGGMLRHVIALACRLQENGHKTLLVGKHFQEVDESISKLKQQAIPFHPLAVEGKFDFRGMQRYRELLKQEHPAVVHFHLGNTFESLAPILITVFMGYPVIVTEHYLPFPLGRKRLLTLLIKRLLAKKIRKVILLGEAFVSPYRQLVKVEREKIVVIPPFSEAMSGSDSIRNKRVIGFAGGFSAAKGVDTLVRLTPRLIALDFKIIFCGYGELAGEIDRLIERYPAKIEKSFFAAGMEAFYKDIGILLFLSRSEGLPLAVLEAISAGVPVISTKVGVLDEYFKEGEGILYLSSSHEGEILSVLLKLTDESFREKISRRGKEVFRQHLDPKKISLQIENLYQEVGGL